MWNDDDENERAGENASKHLKLKPSANLVNADVDDAENKALKFPN